MDDYTETLNRYAVDFEEDHMLFLTTADADESRPCVRLSVTGYEEFRKLEADYWAWQTNLRAMYRVAVRAQMEGIAS